MKLAFTSPKQLMQLLRPLKRVLRHHYFISITALLVVLITAVFMVNQTLRAPSDETYREEKFNSGINAHFDQPTIDKIEQLQRSSDQPDNQPSLPTGARTNPFAE